MTENLKRDRDGEPFQDTFTENRGVRRPIIEEAQHDLSLKGDQVTGGDAAKEQDAGKKEHPQENHP